MLIQMRSFLKHQQKKITKAAIERYYTISQYIATKTILIPE